MFKDLKFVYFN